MRPIATIAVLCGMLGLAAPARGGSPAFHSNSAVQGNAALQGEPAARSDRSPQPFPNSGLEKAMTAGATPAERVPQVLGSEAAPASLRDPAALHDPSPQRDPLPQRDSAVRDPHVLATNFQEKSLPLAPASKSRSRGEAKGNTLAGLFSVALSLAVVLGLFFLATWLFRRGMPKGAGLLSSDVIEVLGRAPLAGRQNMHLIRLGGKLILVSATAGGMDTLAEVTDPLEVDRLLGLCKQTQANSVTGTFKQLLHQFTGEKGTPAARASNPEKIGRNLSAEVADG